MSTKIAIVGCGNMGLIYARAFLKYNIVSAKDLFLVEKNSERQRQLKGMNLGNVVTLEETTLPKFNIVLLCTKPQDFNSIKKNIKTIITEKTVVISIMAGITINTIKKSLASENIVRAMPNSPAEFGLGMTAFTTYKTLKPEMFRAAEQLLASTGRCIYLEKEKDLNAVTALSGSGPAYFFYFVKQLIDSGVAMGLSESTSAQLVKQTMLGSFHLINNAHKPLDDLIATVASKGGTTEAALSKFEKHDLPRSIKEALVAACKRAEELAS